MPFIRAGLYVNVGTQVQGSDTAAGTGGLATCLHSSGSSHFPLKGRLPNARLQISGFSVKSKAFLTGYVKRFNIMQFGDLSSFLKPADYT